VRRQRALQNNPKLTGKVTTKFTIGTNGEVESATDNGSTLADKEVLSCMQAVIKRAQFSPAPAIVGGREVSQGAVALEKGSRPGTTNGFQGRYAIRHPWAGPIACKEPIRNRWGGPPPGEAGAGGSPAPLAAQKTAPRGQPLEAFLAQGVKADIAPATQPAPATSTSTDDAGPVDGGSARTSSRGCAGCSVTRDAERWGWIGGLAIAIAALARRKFH